MATAVTAAASDEEGEVGMVGPYRIGRGDDTLTLRLENRGEITVKAVLLFAFTMTFILIVGVLSIIQSAETGSPSTIDDPQTLFAPTRNHCGFLWLTGTVLMFILVPLYLRRTYHSALVFSFDRAANAFTKSGKSITRLSRIEYVCLRETRDPDGAYLYLLSILYGDGYEVPLYNGYEERTAMNLGNEISSFIHRPVLWK